MKWAGLFWTISLAAISYGCDDTSKKCHPADYECNYTKYRKEILQRPPTFQRAEHLASLNKNYHMLANDIILERDDYISTSLLRITNYLPDKTKYLMCKDSVLLNKLSIRGSKIVVMGQAEEYYTVLSRTCPKIL